MKIIPLLLLIAGVSGSCQLKEQAEELQALKDCTYEVVSADSIYLSNIDVSELVKENTLDLINAPQLAFSYLQKKMPFSAVVNLKITNPGSQEAAINEFEYKVLIKDTEILNGYYDRKISVPPNDSMVIPIKIDRDVYPLIANREHQAAVSGFLGSAAEKSTAISLKIKPAFAVGDKMVKYPDYITIDKTFTNRSLISYLNGLSTENKADDTVNNSNTTEVY